MLVLFIRVTIQYYPGLMPVSGVKNTATNPISLQITLSLFLPQRGKDSSFDAVQ